MSRRAAHVDACEALAHSASALQLSYENLLGYPHTQPLKEVIRSSVTPTAPLTYTTMRGEQTPHPRLDIVPIEGKNKLEDDSNTDISSKKAKLPPTKLEMLLEIKKEGGLVPGGYSIYGGKVSTIKNKKGEVVGLTHSLHVKLISKGVTNIVMFVGGENKLIGKENKEYDFENTFVVEAKFDDYFGTLDAVRLVIMPDGDTFESRNIATNARTQFNELLEPGDEMLVNGPINQFQDRAQQIALKNTIKWLDANKPHAFILERKIPSNFSKYYVYPDGPPAKDDPVWKGTTVYKS